MSLPEIKIGDKVMVECCSGLGSGGPEKITDIKIQYNVKTGKPYKVLYCKKHKFSAKTGNALNEPTMYYISHKI